MLRFLALFTVVLTVLVAPLSSAALEIRPGKGDPRKIDTPHITKEFEISGPGLLKAFTIAGDIEVMPSPKADKVRVELYLDRGFAIWSNSKNLDNYRISILKRGNEIIASVERKQRDTSFFGDHMSFSYRIYVPKSMSTELKTLAGNISLEKVCGTQSVKTAGGSLYLSDISGRLQAYTSGGSIHISNSDGVIYAQTEGGHIELDGNSGEMRLKTSGGKIISERTSGTMLAQVGGGDIHADFYHVGEGISLETSAGDIYLRVPERDGYELVVRGSAVNFNKSAAIQGDFGSGRIEGVYKNGGPPINLTTNAGSITLRIE